MKTYRLIAFIMGSLIVASAARPALPADRQSDVSIWEEFVAALKKGEITPERLRPYYEELRSPLLGYLKEMREKAAWPEWQTPAETHRVGNRAHFLIPLTFDNSRATYCFTFITEDKKWYFQHLEAITIRLDKIGSLPTSTFPDVDEETKAHIREEIRWSREIRLFNLLAREKGKDFAFDFFKEGNGYFLAARTWVPFVEPRKAFVLYLCWEQANLRGNEVALEKLEDDAASIRMRTHYFRLYRVTAHLKQWIPFEDYKRLFETIWQDCARAAGWKLRIEYVDSEYPAGECRLRFSRG
ncbi:MAG: hypothetical protein WAU81_04170 [Candidatus Aminicenantales bacterium]